MAKRLNVKNLKRGISYIKRNGIQAGFYKAKERLNRDADESDYTEEFLKSLPSSAELIKQHHQKFDTPYLISILVPAYNPDEKVFTQLLESVAAQTYANWELCIADASEDEHLRSIVHSFLGRHSLDNQGAHGSADFRSKVKYNHLSKNRGISINTTEALKMASGKYIALLDHDDLLTPNALYEVMKVLSGRTSYTEANSMGRGTVRFVYSDEDKVTFDNTRYFDHHIKPDYDPILLLSNNYICHLTVVETALARSVGGFYPEFDGSQDYDFILRCVECLKESEIGHIPKVLYHWRSTKQSTAENPESKRYAYDAGKKAVFEHLVRIGVKAEVCDTEHLGFHRIVFETPKGSILKISRKEFAALDAQAFNAIKDDFLFVLDDSLRESSSDCEKEMLGLMSIDMIGAVTGKIVKGNTIESAGYRMEKNGGIKAEYAGLNVHYSGYLHRASIIRQVDAFDTGCVMYRRSALTWNGDGPVLEKGKKGVFTPYAVFERK